MENRKDGAVLAGARRFKLLVAAQGGKGKKEQPLF
jgi:hypothetical protein